MNKDFKFFSFVYLRPIYLRNDNITALQIVRWEFKKNKSIDSRNV